MLEKDYQSKWSVVEDWRLCKVYDNDDDADDSTFKQQPAPNKYNFSFVFVAMARNPIVKSP